MSLSSTVGRSCINPGHDLGGLVQVIFGDCGNDSVSLTTPAPAEVGQERKHDNKDAECSSHSDLGAIVAEFRGKWNTNKKPTGTRMG
jgi:hypothetical protein